MNRNLFNCQFRCNQCGYFQLIEFYYKNNMPLIKLICPKNHLKNDINLEHLSNVSTSLICSNCNKTKANNDNNEYFLFNNKIYCNECKENNENFVKIKKIDSKCFIHNYSDFKYYCKIHKDNLCGFCETTDECEIIEIKKFSNSDLENLDKKINEGFNNIEILNIIINENNYLFLNFNENFYNYINKNKISLKFIQKQKIIYEDNCKNFFINNQNILNIIITKLMILIVLLIII